MRKNIDLFPGFKSFGKKEIYFNRYLPRFKGHKH